MAGYSLPDPERDEDRPHPEDDHLHRVSWGSPDACVDCGLSVALWGWSNAFDAPPPDGPLEPV
jgi:hypothetical protein